MNAKERFFAYISGKPVDRVPNLNIIMQFGAQYTGEPYSRYLNDYKCLVDAEIRVAREFGIDCVCAISDPYREAEGYGLEVYYPHNDLSICKGPLLKAHSDIKKLRVPDPLTSKRMNDRLSAVSQFHYLAGDEFPVIGWVEGPIAEAADLRGVSELMYDLVDEPDFVDELMDVCLDGAIIFAREQIARGADVIGVGDAAASLIGPALFEEFVLPREIKLFEAIHDMGALVKLHICGNITGIAPLIARTGADIVDVDHMVDLKMVTETLVVGQTANGNYDPVSILLLGDEAAVDAAVRKCYEQMGGKRAIISAGCEVPRFTSHANMYRVARALQELGSP